ncbi:MAG TPA: CcoQ/FixQ family Cbb3-type cytochrome c oxidase assembly chaperone [Longimicrobiales bacterium]|nr:CcoQ/FixQ family Cbb3-type cytochrome c oxidase assembly chaperone [Longimicrobiales bacterium]
MNPVFHAAGETARYGWLMGVLTVLFLACFVGWTWWAYESGNRERMDEAARLPLAEDDR